MRPQAVICRWLTRQDLSCPEVRASSAVIFASKFIWGTDIRFRRPLERAFVRDILHDRDQHAHLSAGLLYMVGQYEVQWGPLSAGVILSTVPVAVLFSFLQRHLIHGLTAGR